MRPLTTVIVVACLGLGAQPVFAAGGPAVQLALTVLCLAVVYAASELAVRYKIKRFQRCGAVAAGTTAGIEGLLTAIEQASEAIVVTDATGRIEYVNPAFTVMTGYALQEAVGAFPSLLRSGKHGDTFYREMWQTIRSGRVWQGELTNRRKNGSLYTERMSITPVRDGNGDIVSYIAIKQDSTERRAAEQDRRLLASIVSCSQDAIFAHTVDGIILTWNSGAEVLFGYRAEEVISKHGSMLLAPEVRDEAQEHLERILRGEPVPQHESLGVSKDRRRFPISIASSPIRQANGEIVAFSEIVRDLSKAKEAEQYRMLLASIVESSDDAIFATTLDGIIVTWNLGAERMYEYTAQEVVGKHVSRLAPFGPEYAVQDILGMIKSGRSVSHHEAVGQTKSGRRIDISLSVSLMRDSHGKIVGASGITRDITARKRAEAELREAVDAAEAANRAKSDFLANMSHEIRTPMNGIIGMTELLLKTELSPSQRRFGEVVRDSSHGLLAVLDNILDLSKIEARKLTLEVEDFDLRSIVEGTVDLFAVKTQQKGVELLGFIETEVPTSLRGDPARLRQVLTNLVGNAVKFTDRGEVSVRVRLAVEGNPITLMIEVTDTGHGIPAGKQHLLFQPFFQADSSSSRRFTGTGLGLSIVQRLVTMMGGEIGFASEEGKGSRFWFTVVLGRQNVERPETLSLLGRRVLVVAGRPATQALVSEFLFLWQCDFTVISDLSAPALPSCGCDARPWEAVLVDIDSAKVDASSARALVEEARRLYGVPVLLLIPSFWGIDEERWRNLGVAVVTKPLKQGGLGARLAAALGLGPGPRLRRPDAGSMFTAPARRAAYRILAVEDNPMNQAVVVGMLEHLGYRTVDLVSDGRQAIDALSRAEYDAVLMDCQLPQLDGYETTRLIRDPESSVLDHSVVVIAMTAHALAGDRARCLEAGMDDYISKPVQPEVLERVLDFWISRLPAASSPPPVMPARPAATEIVFDREGFLDRLMNNTVLARRVAGAFVRDVPSQLAALSNAIHDADVERIRLVAHSLKGAAATIGGAAVRETAAEIEKLGAAGEVKAAERLLDPLVERTGILCDKVEEFRGEA